MDLSDEVAGSIGEAYRTGPSPNDQQQDEVFEDGLLPPFPIDHHPPGHPFLPVMCVSSPPSIFNRKRDLDEGIGNSSDTPLFSSDDLAASAEDYIAHRNKRQRQGPWWGHTSQADEPIARRRSKREFKRNMDSGVWMGSDTDVDEESNPLSPNHTRPTEPLRDLALRTFEEPTHFDGPIFPYWEEQPISTKHFWQVQESAANHVEKRIDSLDDTVDLSTRGLTKLQGPTLEPLQYFFPDPSSLEDDDGPQLIHGLKIFLANNLLTRLPGRLLRLENLTVLSLRGNKLTELPPAIGNLVHLRELNVGSNNLRWLPYEIRDLLKRHLKLFGFHPNPFIRPMPRYKTYSWMLQHHFCSSKPALLHSDGTLVHNSPPSPTNTPVYWPKVQPGTFEQEEPEHTDRVPSLYETCLRNLYHSPQLSQLPFLIPGEAPPSLVPALKHTWYLKQEGGQRCTICKTPFIMPRTEWIEWWQLSVKGKADAADPEDRKPTGPNLFSDAMLIGSPVPLLRRGCSWACVPKSAINRTGWSQAKGVQSDDGPSTLRHIDSEEWRPPS